MEWIERAACVGEDPELFFPVGRSGPALRDVREAKAVCAGCPVVAECLSWAVATGQTNGVWGGLTEVERAELCRARSALGAGRARLDDGGGP
ncbi:WhiB family transcriptional regulator [Streptomyces sp. NPDC005423]|uniref:WhiB family transcriptional regulator n=1 Tax=Streptomyces sp. NPDC005423 TaxID=3155343 RepID=UPI0033BBD847